MKVANMEQYKLYIYIIITLASTFALSGINFNNFFKKSKIIESRIFIILLVLSLSYLTTNFIIDFIEVSKIL